MSKLSSAAVESYWNDDLRIVEKMRFDFESLDSF